MKITKNLCRISSLAFAFLLVLAFSSCSHKMVGVWDVQRYETTAPGQQGTVLYNLGTMEFKRNGRGEKNLSYSVLGMDKKDQVPFQWTADEDKYISIESEGSEFSKIWIIMENKRKSQKWKTTDGNSAVQILELKKQ